MGSKFFSVSKWHLPCVTVGFKRTWKKAISHLRALDRPSVHDRVGGYMVAVGYGGP